MFFKELAEHSNMFEMRSLITGAHRSGTTWLGEALAASGECSVLHEPFNYEFGVEGVPSWYPKLSDPEKKQEIELIVENILSGRARFRTERSREPFWKRAVRRLTGGPENWRYKRIIRNREPHLVLKDPFCVRFAQLLVRSFGFRAIILVRHPGAYLNSLKRVSWAEVLPDLGSQEQMATHDVVEKTDEELLAHRTGVFWTRIYSEVLEQVARHPDEMLLVRHEDLCVDPVGMGERVFRHLGISFNLRARDFMERSTRGAIVEPHAGVVHSLERHSAAMVEAWRTKLSENEKRMLAETGKNLLEKLYPDLPIMV